jgi:hypothetical protein
MTFQFIIDSVSFIAAWFVIAIALSAVMDILSGVQEKRFRNELTRSEKEKDSDV